MDVHIVTIVGGLMILAAGVEAIRNQTMLVFCYLQQYSFDVLLQFIHFWPEHGVSFEYLDIVPNDLQAFYLRVLLVLNWLIFVGVCGPFLGESSLLSIFLV